MDLQCRLIKAGERSSGIRCLELGDCDILSGVSLAVNINRPGYKTDNTILQKEDY